MNRSKRVHGLAGALAAVALTVVLTGCGEFFTPVNNNPSGTGTTSYVYVIHSGGTLAEYSLASGVLAELSGSPITPSVAPTSVVVSPNDEFAYVGTGTGVFLYTIGSDGALTEGNGDDVLYLSTNVTTPIESMVIDPSGTWLILAYQNSTVVEALAISTSTGGLTTTSPYVFKASAVTTNPQLAISAANTQVYMTLGAGGTEAIGFNHLPTSASTNGPWGTSVSIPVLTATNVANGVAVDPTSTYVYISEANNSTTATAGTVRLLATASLGKDLDDEPAQVAPTGVLADLSGDYVYIANSTTGTSGSISGYSIDTTAQKLTLLGTYPTEASPIALVEDKSKSYIFDVGSGNGPNLWLYSFDATSLGSLDVKTTTSTLDANPTLANGIAITH